MPDNPFTEVVSHCLVCGQDTHETFNELATCLREQSIQKGESPPDARFAAGSLLSRPAGTEEAGEA
jgi:hypothetical protein